MAALISNAEINTLQTSAISSAKQLGPSIPGVGDPAKKASDIITKEASKYSKEIKILVSTLLIAVMSGVAINNIPEINRQINKLKSLVIKLELL